MTLQARLLSTLILCTSALACAAEIEGDEREDVSQDDALDNSGLTVLGPTFTEGALPAHGGGGGSFFAHITPSAVIDGIQVRSGSEIDGLRLHYYQPTSSTNSPTGVSSFWTPWYGGGGGTVRAAFFCPAGKAVIGISGRAGARVDGLQVICGIADSPNPTSPLNNFSPSWGGGGGTTFGPDLCTSGRLVSSFNVRAGSKIDNIQAICINAH